MLTGPELLDECDQIVFDPFFFTNAKQSRGSGEAETVRSANYYEAVGTCTPYCTLPAGSCV